MQPTHRSYSKSFKAQVIQECAQPGASIASIALSHSLNANLVHKWIRLQTQNSTGCNLHLFHSPCRWPEQMRKLHRPISVLKSSTRVAPSKLIGQLKTLPLARPFFETFCDDSHRLHLARHSSGVLVAVIVASAWRSSVGWIATPA
jgi:transposase-like protein